MSMAARVLRHNSRDEPLADHGATVKDINVMVAGRGGDGSLTIINLLSRLLCQRGFHLVSSRNVASRIKGGHAAAMLRGSLVHRWGQGDHFDILVGFDDQALVHGGRHLKRDSVVIFDSSVGEADASLIPSGVRVINVPFGRMAVRDFRRELLKNSFGFGLLTRCLNASDDEAMGVLKDHVRRFSEQMARANVEALEEGFRVADQVGLVEGAGLLALGRSEHKQRLLMSGNEATAMGFLAAGGRFFSGYPITPATDIFEWLRPRLAEFGGAVVQAEDELAAINMATGAALAGARSMTATSGPGLALMMEGVGNLGTTEIPLVIVDTQRAGPSTGMPTKPEQSDIDMMVYGGNGEFPRIVLAPCHQADCFGISFQATNLSQQLQCPVFIALDQGIGQNSATMRPFELEKLEIETGKRLSTEDLTGLETYRRYQITEDGISPWAVPGTPGGMNLVTGNEHDEWGLVSTQADNRRRMMEKRSRKIELALDLLPRARRGGVMAAPIGILSVGMVCGTVREAVERLQERGIDVEILEPRTIWPVLGETIDFVKNHDRCYVVELNFEGQLARILTAAGAPADKLQSLRQFDGVPLRPGALVDEIERRERAAGRNMS